MIINQSQDSGETSLISDEIATEIILKKTNAKPQSRLIRLIRLKKISSLLGGFLTMLCIGNFYLWGAINNYITSYYRLYDNPNLTLHSSNVIFPLLQFVITTTLILGIPIANRIGYSWTHLIFGVLSSCSIFVASFMKNFWLFTLFYGIFFGLFSGSVQLISPALASLNYPQNQGIVQGIIYTGFGLSTLITSNLMHYWINPQNMSPMQSSLKQQHYFGSDIANNVPSALRKLSLYLFILFIIAAILIFQPQKSLEQIDNNNVSTDESHLSRSNIDQNSNNQEQNSLLKSNKKSNKILMNQTFSVLKQGKFIIILIMTIFSTAYPSMIQGDFKQYGFQYNISDHFLTLVATMASIFNGPTRIVLGYIEKKMQFFYMYVVMMLLQIIAAYTIPYAIHSRIAYLFYVCFANLTCAAHFLIFPMLLIRMYGVELGFSAFSLVNYSFSTGNLLQYLLILVMPQDQGYSHDLFFILASFSVISLVLAVFFHFKYERLKE